MNTDINPALLDQVLDLTIDIQKIPAPPFGEGPRADFVQARFDAEGLSDVSSDETGNVFGRLAGMGERPPLVVAAHLDTVFPASTPLESRSEAGRIHGPGIGDNSLGVASLFGLLWCLGDTNESGGDQNKQNSAIGSRGRGTTRLPGDVWLVASVGEEGLGNLRGMRAVVDRFGKDALAYIILEGMGLGQVYHRGLGVQRYRVIVNTPGGHSWVDAGRPSAIHELAALTTRLAGLPLPARPRTSLNVGVIAGGTSVNTIAAEANLEIDMRSESGSTLSALVGQVRTCVKQANRAEVQATIELIGDRPAGKIPASHPLVRLAKRCLQAQGLQPNLAIGSTDANAPLSRGLPAICVGLSTGQGAHTLQEFINTQPLTKGLAQLVDLVTGAFRELS
jgi:tripeptide aminopeptidase